MKSSRNRETPNSIARNKAKAIGEKYYRGTICKRHPESMRYTNSGQCVDCKLERNNQKNHASIYESSRDVISGWQAF